MRCKALSGRQCVTFPFWGIILFGERWWEGAGTCDVSVYRTTVIMDHFRGSVS
jgi:hypothetical protein